jgi:hypothetical protein
MYRYLVEMKGLQAEGVEEPGKGALTVVGEYDHLQTGSEQSLTHKHCAISVYIVVKQKKYQNGYAS